MTERRMVKVPGGELETWSGGEPDLPSPLICAAHPADAFGKDTVALLRDLAHARVVCVNPRGLGGSSRLTPASSGALEEMVDDIEAARVALGLGPWVFWGMSGGGWLGLIYARRHPDALAGLILESADACFRVRLADPACVLSPQHPAWRQKLAEAGLLAERSSDERGASDPRADYDWLEVPAVGRVLRERGGGALLVSPIELSPEMLRIMPALLAVDERASLPSVALPALVMCGDADPIVPIAHARALYAALPDCEFVEISGGGHVPGAAERRPEVAAAVGRFLAELQ
jgi:pimeloyl-ACP methyl ester carboxylesterase